MRIWTTLLSLVIVCLMVCNVYAQDKKGHGSSHQHASFKDMAGSDDAKLTEDAFVKARTQNAPEDKKAEMETRAKAMWKRVAGDKTELTKDEFEDGYKKAMEAFKAKGGKGRSKKGGE